MAFEAFSGFRVCEFYLAQKREGEKTTSLFHKTVQPFSLSLTISDPRILYIGNPTASWSQLLILGGSDTG